MSRTIHACELRLLFRKGGRSWLRQFDGNSLNEKRHAMESILQLYQLAMIVLPVYGFVSLRKQVRRSELTKWQASLRNAGMVFAPMLAYTAIYFLVLGVDAVLDVNLVSEEISRSLPLAMALGLAVWLLSVVVFSVGIVFLRSTTAAMPPKP